MSKVRDISNLSNIIRTDASGNVSFVSGSTTLATLNTSGQLSGSSPVLSSSYALNATSASYAASASNATNAVTASFANAFTVAGTLTAQTLVVQMVTASFDYITGSSINGSLSTNTHQFTGSVLISGSATAFRINASDLFVSSSGQVGIGTITPAYNLDVTGTGRFTGALNLSNTQLYAYNSTGLLYGRFGWEAGYGTTGAEVLSYGSSAYQPLKFRASQFDFYPNGTTSTFSIASTGAATFSSSVTALKYIANAQATYSSLTYEETFKYSTSPAGIWFGNSFNSNNNVALQLRTSNDGTSVQAMTITSGGTVLINTTSSSGYGVFNTYKTPVASNYVDQIIVQGTGNYPSLRLGTYDAYDGVIATTGNDLRILAGLNVTTENHNIMFYTSPNGGTTGAQSYERMRIAYNGYVGIGANPATTLHVAGPIGGGSLVSGAYPQNVRHAKAGGTSVTFTITVPYINAWYAGHVLIKCSGAQNGLQESYAAMYIATLTYYGGGGVSATVTAIGGSTGSASVSISATSSSNPQVITITVSDVGATTNTFTADIDATIYGGIISIS